MIALLLAAALAASDVDLSAEPLPAPLVLSDAERETLERGGSVYRYDHRQGQELGVAATLVRCAPAAIWPHVLDVDAWVEFLPYVTASRDVRQGVDAEGDPVYESSFELTTKGVTTRYTLHNRWLQDEDAIAFTIASLSGSPVRHGVGWWRASPWPADPSLTLLTYRVRLELAWYVPRWFERRAAATGLPRLSALIGERAEALAPR